MPGEFALDGQGPLYRQIRRAIAAPILAGELVPGIRLPSEHDLTAMFRTSRMTVNRALGMLADEGLVSRHRRNGTFVAAQVAEHAVMDVRDIADEVAESGAAYAFTLLHRRRVKADRETADVLGVRKGTALLHLSCRHDGDAVPFVVEDRFISLAAVPEAEHADFTEIPPSRWLLETVPWTKAEHAIVAVNASKTLARGLGIAEGNACLVVERRTWLADRPVTFVRLTYPGDRHRLVGGFTPGR